MAKKKRSTKKKTKTAKKKTRSSSTASPPASLDAVVEHHDRRLAQSAMAKVNAGQRPTKEEAAALRRVQRNREEELRWQYYREIPQKHYREMSGRQPKVLKEQALRYGIPFGGAKVDLTTVIPAFHQFLADNKYRLNQLGDPANSGDEFMAGDTDDVRRFQRAKADLAEMERDEKAGHLILREDMHDGFMEISAALRAAMEKVNRIDGECGSILSEALDDADQTLIRMFGHGPSE